MKPIATMNILLQIWNTVKKADKRSATMFWPGSDVKIQGTSSFSLILLVYSRVQGMVFVPTE